MQIDVANIYNITCEYSGYAFAWICKNKSWLFSGLGTNAIVGFFAYKAGKKNTIRTVIKENVLRIDHNKYMDLTAGLSGIEYVALANGLVSYTSEGNSKFFINNIQIGTTQAGTNSYNILKNQKWRIEYTSKISNLRFYYACEENK